MHIKSPVHPMALLLVVGLALCGVARPAGAQTDLGTGGRVDNRLEGIWYSSLKGLKAKHAFFAFFPKGRLVTFLGSGAVSTLRWARRGNRLTFTGPGVRLVYTISFKRLARIVQGRRVLVTLLTLRDSKGVVSGWTSAQLGLEGRLKGSYCAWSGSSNSSLGFFGSYSKTTRYRFDGRGRVRYTVRVVMTSYSTSSRGVNIARDSKKGRVGKYFVLGKNAILMWPNGSVDFPTISSRARKGRAAYLTFDRRRYDPALCN